MKSQKKSSFFLILLLNATLTVASAGTIGQKPVTDDVFKTGKIRFVPLLTITDEAMAGKAFFSQPNDLAIDDKGRIYVSDGKANDIKVFDASGAFVKTIGRTGQGPGEFTFLWESEFSRGRLFVRELISKRTTIFDAEGKFLKSVPEEGPFVWRSMAALPDGRILVQKELINRQDLSAPQGFVLDLHSADLAFIKTIYKHEIRRNKFIRDPITANIPIPFAANVHWAVLPDGKIVVGYSDRYGIEIHDPDKGQVASFEHTYEPVEVSAADKKAHFEKMTINATIIGDDGSRSSGVKKGAPDYIVKNTEFPKFKPAFDSIRADAQGRIWVRRSAPAIQKDGPLMDVFDRSGRFIGTVVITGGLFPYSMAPVSEGFWTLEVNPDGNWSAVKYGIEALR
ncbi:MAG: 6-bladed beta-propeller [Candidatus Aminicenantes bacterium]|nr:6-bladed beta-propeller [Candidatus Aminicenantes bacterium]